MEEAIAQSLYSISDKYIYRSIKKLSWLNKRQIDNTCIMYNLMVREKFDIINSYHRRGVKIENWVLAKLIKNNHISLSVKIIIDYNIKLCSQIITAFIEINTEPTIFDLLLNHQKYYLSKITTQNILLICCERKAWLTLLILLKNKYFISSNDRQTFIIEYFLENEM